MALTISFGRPFLVELGVSPSFSPNAWPVFFEAEPAKDADAKDADAKDADAKAQRSQGHVLKVLSQGAMDLKEITLPYMGD